MPRSGITETLSDVESVRVVHCQSFAIRSYRDGMSLLTVNGEASFILGDGNVNFTGDNTSATIFPEPVGDGISLFTCVPLGNIGA